MLLSRRTSADRATGGLLLLALLALAALVAAGIAKLPGPIVDRAVEASLRLQADLWTQRLLERLDHGQATFTLGEVTAADAAYLAGIPLASDVHRLRLLDAGGRTIWSSRPSEADRVERGVDFTGAIALGQVHYAQERRSYEQIDNAALHIGADEQSLTRVVARIGVPLMDGSRFAGAVEFHRDVTLMREAGIARLRAAVTAVCGGALALFGVLTWGLVRTSRRRVDEVRAQADKARALMADQVRLTREVRLLGELNEWLQSSRSLPELFSMVARFMAQILPGSAGTLYVYSNSRDVLDGATAWSGGAAHAHIRPEECWALRRGRAYGFGENAVDFPCGHHGPVAPARSVCIPILAHGETIGLISLAAPASLPAAAFEAERRLAQMCAEQISMAIANVRMRDELQHQAIRDPLTGLFNSRHLHDVLRRLTQARGAREVSLVALDVDHFKRFNDNFGHDAGDMVLRAVGEALGRQADGDEVACRVGGEEFTLLLPGLGPEAALARAERVRAEIAAVAVRYGDRTLPRVTVSVGVAHCPTHGTMPQAVIRAADEALYAAKAQGRNQVVLAGAAPDLAAWGQDAAADAEAGAAAPAAA